MLGMRGEPEAPLAYRKRPDWSSLLFIVSGSALSDCAPVGKSPKSDSMLAIRAGVARRPNFILIIFIGFMAMLWVGGGASSGAEAGQALVRLAASSVIVLALLLGPRPALAMERPIWLIFGACALLVILQFVPLPAAWSAAAAFDMPVLGRLVGTGMDARPLAIVSGAALNAGFSLIVPLATLLLLSMTEERHRRHLPAILLIVIGAGALLALWQMSGSRFDNPLINETVGQASGNFANRNHFALFLAMGCLLAPVWASKDHYIGWWRVGVAAGLILLFVLLVLGTGSRAGLVLTAVALGFGLMLSRSGLRRMLQRLPRWALPAMVIGFIIFIGVSIWASVVMDRAVGIERLQDVGSGQDMRWRGLPVVLGMIHAYLPLGTGLGAFDPFFRFHEPMTLLKPTYFNHAHNDFLEVALGAGIPGVMLLAVGILWWCRESIRVWQSPPSHQVMLARLGSTMLLLVLLASAFDYPARTPMMMATIMIAATWLAWGRARADRPALPVEGRHL